MISEARSLSNPRSGGLWRAVGALGWWKSVWLSAGLALLGGVFGEELVDALVQMIEHRAKQGIKRKRPASK